MRFKLSVDNAVLLEEMTPIFELMLKRGWRISLVDNGNILFEKETEEKK